MRFLIKALKLRDYRNIKDKEIVQLGTISSLVGANESGKTSILNAIHQLSEYKLTNKDSTKGTARADSGKTPILKFFLEPNGKLKEWIKKRALNFNEGNLLCLTLNSTNKSSWSVSLVKEEYQETSLKLKHLYKNVTDQAVEVEQDDEVVNLNPNKVTLLIGRSTRNMNLVRLGKLTKLPEEKTLTSMRSHVLKYLPKVIWWPPSKLHLKGASAIFDEFYIKDKVPFADFINNPSKHPSTKRLFEISKLLNSDFDNWQEVLKGYVSRKEFPEASDYLDNLAKQITAVIKERWNQSRVSIKFSMEPEGNLDISIYENNKRIRPSTRSEGFKWFLSFLLYFFSDEQELTGRVFLMDQPGEYLHPGGQKELRKRLEEFCKKGQNQMIYATQSPFLIDRNEWKKTQFLDKTPKWTTVREPDVKDVYNDALLRDSLGYTLADVGQANEYNLVFEGYTDRWIVQTVARVIKNNSINVIKDTDVDFDLNRLAFIEAQGALGRYTVFEKVQELSSAGLKVIGIYDSDQTGEKALIKSREDPTLDKKIFQSYRTLLVRAGVKTGEDLIPVSMYKSTLKQVASSLSSQKINKLSKKPRDKNLKDHFRDEYSDKKDKIWNIIRENLREIDKNESDLKEFLEEKEVQLCLKLINRGYEFLQNQS